MLTRRLLFSCWSSVSGKPEYKHGVTLGLLLAKVKDDPNFAVIDDDGVTTAVEVVDAGSDQSVANLKLYSLRGTEDRPFKWDPSGSASAIALRPDEYIADVTHISIWPDGICAHDYTKHSPSISRLSYFMRNQLNCYIGISPIYQEDTFARLSDMKGKLRSVEVAITKPEYLLKDRGAYSNLIPGVFGEKAPSVKVVIGMGRYGPRDRFLDSAIEEDVFALAEQASDYVSQMIIKGRSSKTNRVETVNLLSERLQTEGNFQPSTEIPSLPDSGEVFHELDQSYKMFKSGGVFERSANAKLVGGAS
ncbi:MAG TPA: DUF6731 family protein [Bryobacteraceae bacterium]